MTTETLEKRKIELIVKITKLDDDKDLRKVEETVEVIENSPTEKQLEMLKKLAKPMRKKLDIEELKREQNWKPTSREEIDKILEDFDWQISDEDFIKLLKDT